MISVDGEVNLWHCWIIWYSTTREKYEPKRALFDKYSERLQWKSKELCQEQCRMMNEKPKI